MGTKLKLVFRNQKLRLALKAIIFAGLLAIVKLGGFYPLPVLIFFGRIGVSLRKTAFQNF